MPNSEENNASDNASVGAKSVLIPRYTDCVTSAWFTLMEAYFYVQNITSQKYMFILVAAHLPPHIQEQVMDILGNVPPENAYEILKSAVLTRTLASDSVLSRQILSHVEMDNRTPSQLLGYMGSLLGGLNTELSILREFWLAALPGSMRSLLDLQPPDTPLHQLAQLADQLHDCLYTSPLQKISKQATSEVTVSEESRPTLRDEELGLEVFGMADHPQSPSKKPSRSRHRRRSSHSSRNVCYYHRRFKNRARKCIPPCSFRSPTGASGKALSNQ